MLLSSSELLFILCCCFFPAQVLCWSWRESTLQKELHGWGEMRTCSDNPWRHWVTWIMSFWWLHQVWARGNTKRIQGLHCGPKLHQGKFRLDTGKNSSLEGWLGTGIVCPGMWWRHHLWVCLKTAWMWHSVPCLVDEEVLGLTRWSQGSFPTFSVILLWGRDFAGIHLIWILCIKACLVRNCCCGSCNVIFFRALTLIYPVVKLM